MSDAGTHQALYGSAENGTVDGEAARWNIWREAAK